MVDQAEGEIHLKRKQRRTIRYRPVRQERLIAIRVALIAVVAVSVSLMFTAVWRTIATHRLNAQLQALHTSDGALRQWSLLRRRSPPQTRRTTLQPYCPKVWR